MKSKATHILLTTLIIILSNNSIIFAQENNLHGEWTLVSIITDTGAIKIPDTISLYLIISKDELKYNLNVNSCWTTFKLKNSEIIYSSFACTEICCDERYAELINYSGEFYIEDQELIITNSIGRFQLNRRE